MAFTRRAKADKEFHDKGYDRLATFNAEQARGLIHTPDYVEEMEEIQERFDEEYGGPLLSTREANRLRESFEASQRSL